MPRRSSRLKSVLPTALDPLAHKQYEVNGVVRPWKWQVGDALYLHFPEGDVNDPANIALCEVTRPPANPHLIGPKAKLSTCQLDWLMILKGEDSGGVGWTEETTLELFLRRLPSEEAKEEYKRIVKERKEEDEGEGQGEDVSFVGIIDETKPTLEGELVLAATTPKPQNPQTPQLNVSPADEVKRSQSQSASQPLSQLNRKVLVLPSQGGENGTPFSASPASKTPPKKYLGKINEEEEVVEEVVEEKKKNKWKRKPELEPEPESEEAPPKKKKKKGKVYVGPSVGALIKAEFTGKQNDGQVKKIFCCVVTSVGHDKRGPFGMVEYVDGEEWKFHWEAGQKWEDATQGDIDREHDMIAAAAAVAAEEDESEDDDESGDSDGEVVATARVSKKRTILSAESDSVDSSQRNTQNKVDSIVGNQESGDEVEVVAETEDLQESSDDEIALFASQISDKLKDKLNNELNDDDSSSSSSSSIPAIGFQLVVGSQPNFSQVSTPDVVGGPPTTGEKPAPPLLPHSNATLTSPQPQSQESTQDSIVINVDENPNVGSPPRGWGAGDDSSGSDGSSH
ncbi:hypothetical protein TrLO_g610 [Triparma laevis f. longispina]|uniref:Uncharacterized protein n=1 Tax=Triparma laevis f. longispina TaxID=1714387 RepID=A0A9W7F7Z9_9STRA|nr:hypothetical protein TrLO_g610 [Triparma laevis f. longispina]